MHVPYRGSSGARADILAGQVQYMFDAVPTMVQNIRAGKVRALAVTGLKRSPLLPELPTMQEAGIAGYESSIWLGIMAPAKTPRDVVVALNGEINKAIGRAGTRDEWAKQGADAMVMSVTEFDRFIREDITRQGLIIKLSGAKAD